MTNSQRTIKRQENTSGHCILQTWGSSCSVHLLRSVRMWILPWGNRQLYDWCDMQKEICYHVTVSEGGGPVWKQGGYMETGKWASHPLRQHIWSQAEQTHTTSASGTTDEHPQIIHYQNHLPRLCLSKLLWVCPHLSYISPAQSPAAFSKQLHSCLFTNLEDLPQTLWSRLWLSYSG